VRLEPVGIEFEVDEDETILRGAFRQGLMLMHGCKEGQCAACKSFLLDGEVDLDRYSNFALNDYEKEEGWTLLCRAHAMSDLEVELINYDEEVLRSGVPEQTEELMIETLEPLTHDIYRLVLDATKLQFRPGQYVDITIPGSGGGEGDTRSFSMANLPASGKLEFMIKAYPEGRFSSLLAGGEIAQGQTLTVTGPYGVFTLRRASDRPLLFIGGGAGMAPILALLRSLADEGSERSAVFYYGARTPADLFHLDELRELERRLPNFRFVPALSDCGEDADWEGERGMITEVVIRREQDLSGMDAYLCGPPPMVDAAIAMLDAKGVPEDRVFYDKFTTTAPE
ncbi:MAG TPA: 2Fe-2S iron-sulfur cluster binding domain-containing protein, partial [Solirubrobacteraceae bacterium]|nr:2Fe-2S iron-sulfur cluster binding domain-containing protein [Solirubrobacteraceae bacterium]